MSINVLLILDLLCLIMNSIFADSEARIQSNNMYPASNTSCLCPGDILRYECTIIGIGTTLWQGNAFMILNCDYIALLHSQFTQGTYGTCNGGTLIGSSLRAENGSYTSQLDVTISRDLDGHSIECAYDSGTQPLTIIGMSKVKLKGPVPPPDRIMLSLDRSGWLIFSWNEVVTTCDVVHYRIIASNCGRCPTTTAHLTAVCTNVPTNSNNMCTFAVQTLVCDGVAGNVSDPLLALLRVPDAPTGLKVIPRYSYSSGHFSGITVEFNSEVSTFNITDEIDGSTLSYTLTYADGNSGSVCGSAIMPASLCNSGICRHVFDANSSSICSTSNVYNATVLSTNLLRNGYTSSIVTIITYSINVSVSFDLSSKRVICYFDDPDMRNEKTCRIMYGPGTECRIWNSTKTISSLVTSTHSDSVIIGLVSLPNKEPINCFIATLTSGTFVAEIEGTLDTASKLDGASTIEDHTILVISLGVTITTVILAISVIIHITITVVRLRAKKRCVEKLDCTSMNPRPVATEPVPPVIYEDLDQVNKDIDLENNLAYSTAHAQPK